MPTDTQHSRSNGQQQMDAVVIQASGPPAQSLAYRCEPVPEPGRGRLTMSADPAPLPDTGPNPPTRNELPQLIWSDSPAARFPRAIRPMPMSGRLGLRGLVRPDVSAAIGHWIASGG